MPTTQTRRPELSAERSVAWFGLLATHASLTRAVEARLAAGHELSFSAYEILFRIDRCEPQPARAVAAQVVSISPTRVSRVVDQLVARGLLERAGSADDGRVSLISITTEGRRALDRASRTFHAVVEEQFYARLDDDDIHALARIWSKLGDQAC